MFEVNSRHSTENTFSCNELGLPVEGSVNFETITGLLEKSQNPVLLEGYLYSRRIESLGILETAWHILQADMLAMGIIAPVT